MSKQYRNLWVFGDSYSTPGFCVDPADSFWGLLAKYAGIKYINNCSRPTNSFDTVCHLLITLNDKIDWSDDLVIIGVPPLERVTVFDDYKNTEYLGYHIDTDSWAKSTFGVPGHRGLVCQSNFGGDRVKILYNNRSWIETNAMREIFLLTQWLDRIDADYMIVNLGKNLNDKDIWAPNDFLLPYCINHKRCLLFKDTYQSVNYEINRPVDFDTWQWAGHHGAEGNRYFFEKSLLPKIKDSGLLC